MPTFAVNGAKITRVDCGRCVCAFDTFPRTRVKNYGSKIAIQRRRTFFRGFGIQLFQDSDLTAAVIPLAQTSVRTDLIPRKDHVLSDGEPAREVFIVVKVEMAVHSD